MNTGEEICGEWLRHLRKCDFIQYNLKLPEVQGELDVIGLNLKEKTVYTCEVAVHLVTGLLYVRGTSNDNVARLTDKFRKNINYVRRTFPDYRQVFMLWSPIVKGSRTGAKENQVEDVRRIVETVHDELGVPIELVINDKFQVAIDELRSFARKQTKELDSTVLRYLQIEEYLGRHLRRSRTEGDHAI